MLPSLVAGLGLGFSLIIAIGAQNLFVLRQGLRREHVLLVATICAVSDAVLIVLGVSGIGLVLQAVPWLVDVVRWAGAIFLVTYGLLAARRAWRPSGETLRGDDTPVARGATASGTVGTVATKSRALPAVLTVLALTWLNPHVYLDTVFLLGSVANTHGDTRWWFAAGAVVASIVWFFALAIGARYLSRWLSTPRAWRILDGVIAAVMIGIGISLVLPH
ncbi:LysE/ArgO family amino acid transporter [Microbacterium sp. SLBN-146]|uniref:LysE/ArgO family amino acid transporter n=1 Tax=Microbacterium sp. SLBN-146 TaxID=2768457 RepID=UPI00114F71C3|nr:LysE/ArgO family amino acid transporter [Microbacterium sp. SLBN-146]TQJ31206.1 L-lysine exporter family protein LysE/ArgO [Microbacterium sp. SLBN-146]